MQCVEVFRSALQFVQCVAEGCALEQHLALLQAVWGGYD